MPRIFSVRHALDLAAGVIAAAAALAVVYTFAVGRHYVIPTLLLSVAVVFGNLARHAYLGRAWARHLLVWIFFVLACHLFFALFFAARPRVLLGAAFYPVYGTLFVVFALLVWQYARAHRLFRI